MVLTTGTLDAVDDAIHAGIQATFTHTGFGSGATAPTASDTALVSETVRNARQSYDHSGAPSVVSGFLSASQANATTVQEFGVFDAAAAGNLKQRAILSVPIAKTSAKEVWCDVTIASTVTQS